MFFRKSDNYHYSEAITLEEGLVTETYNYNIPLVVDTEFQDTLQLHPELYLKPRTDTKLQKTITVQCRHVFKDERYIFAHPDIRDIARHPIFEEEFIGFQYLREQGYDLEVKHYSAPIRPERRITFHIFSHFAVAELFRMFQGETLKEISALCLDTVPKQKIDQGRRVIASNTRIASKEQQFVSLEKTVTIINGEKFGVNLAIWDTCALFGNQSLEKLIELAGLDIKDKKLLNLYEKENMLETYQSKPDAFDSYASGADLDVYDVVIALEKKLQSIYTELGLETYFKIAGSMRFTIGATVAKIFESQLMKELGIKNKALREYTKHGTCEVIKENNTTVAYLAKVDGGRCRNNRPTDVSIDSLLCDIDIDGCYGNGLRNQIYPLGRPVLLGYKTESKINEYMTLGEFRKAYGKELVPGLWHARGSYREGYTPKHSQDFLMSWYPPKNLKNIPSDSEVQGNDWWTVDNVGLSKVLNQEVNLALINHDYLQLIDNVCGQRQRKELHDNLLVVAAAFYPASCRVDSYADLVEKTKDHNGKNRTYLKKVKNNPVIVSEEQECHAWLGINLGDLLVDKLLTLRKGYAKKSEFNLLYKLIINTIYGDQVSPFFEIGNVIVGNNITARARCMAWYMEKGLHGFATITDGCTFELNKVIHEDNHQRVTSNEVFEAYCKSSDIANYKFKPLGGSEITASGWIWDEKSKVYIACLEQEDKELSYSDIGRMCLEHLQKLFPNVDVLHAETYNLKGEKVKGQFALEVKVIASGASFQGSANYIFNQGNYYLPSKMRSYRGKPHRSIRMVVSGSLEIVEGYKPSDTFLKNLYNTPTAVQQEKVFVDTSILKIKSWKQLFYSRYESSGIFPGCTLSRTRILRLFSLNQFTFQTMKQYQSWEREWKNLIANTGHSYEQFFLNDDGTVNVQEMVNRIDKLIREGKEDWFKRGGLRRYLHANPGTLKNHTEIKCLTKTQENLGVIYGYAIIDNLDDATATDEVFDEEFDYEV